MGFRTSFFTAALLSSALFATPGKASCTIDFWDLTCKTMAEITAWPMENMPYVVEKFWTNQSGALQHLLNKNQKLDSVYDDFSVYVDVTDFRSNPDVPLWQEGFISYIVINHVWNAIEVAKGIWDVTLYVSDVEYFGERGNPHAFEKYYRYDTGNRYAQRVFYAGTLIQGTNTPPVQVPGPVAGSGFASAFALIGWAFYRSSRRRC